MPGVPEELDVFRGPHFHMKQLVQDIERELGDTNFKDSLELHTLLSHLHQRFGEFKCHEEIENKYIVKELLPRLPAHTKATLDNDIHSDNRLSDLVNLVDSALSQESCRNERECLELGEHLKEAIANFTIDFIPHMDEEEEVYLPLLLEHFSEEELRQLTLHVLELHKLPPSQGKTEASATNGDGIHSDREEFPNTAPSTSLLTLPPEVLVQILSYLSPKELLSLVPLHSILYHLTRDSTLWLHLHPVRWNAGHWKFYKPPQVQNQTLLCNGLIEDNNVTKELLSAGTTINANLRTKSLSYDNEEDVMAMVAQRELTVLQGVMEHILPHVGSHVLTLDLSHSKAATNELVFRILRQCPRLRFLDLSYTRISDFAFRGFQCKEYCRWQLEHVDLTGCSLITDEALRRIARSLASPHHTPTTSTSSSSSPRLECGGGGGGARGQLPRLRCLILSGCYRITDEGLRSLATPPGLPYLHYLNLSGLPNVTPRGLSALVSTSPHLPPDLLFYCENIDAGPYAECANGCTNVGSSSLQCCRQGM